MAEQARIAVVVAGASGRTGREVARAVWEAPDLQLVGALGSTSAGRDVGEVWGIGPIGLAIHGEPQDSWPRRAVWVDFTHAEAARRHLPWALRRGMAAVVGTTGLTAQDLQTLRDLAEEHATGVCVVPNFSLGAMLVARLSALAVETFPHVEIVELHGAHKLDRPSGTAAALAAHLEERSQREVPIHSVRLPGLVAHQEVLFGGSGELLTLRHDVWSRQAYVPGTLLAVRKAPSLRGLVTRLEEIWEG
jgi:4-hydroxy-tetrahydrodipicolinate reductase